MPEGSSEPIKPPDDKSVARPEVVEDLSELWTLVDRPTCGVRPNAKTARGCERVGLALEALISRRDAGVAKEHSVEITAFLGLTVVVFRRGFPTRPASANAARSRWAPGLSTNGRLPTRSRRYSRSARGGRSPARPSSGAAVSRSWSPAPSSVSVSNPGAGGRATASMPHARAHGWTEPPSLGSARRRSDRTCMTSSAPTDTARRAVQQIS